MEIDDITGTIVDTAFKIHVGLGPGLLESVYEAVLAKALERKGLKVERQKAVTFNYDGMVFDEGFRVDLLVENIVVVKLKSVEKLAPVHSKQVLTYLRLMDLRVGCSSTSAHPPSRKALTELSIISQPPRLRASACTNEPERIGS